MPDLDDLLRSDIAGTASRSVEPPAFGAVVARGRRRRNRSRAAAAAACVLAALAAGSTVLDLAGHSTEPRPANPQPTLHHVHRPPGPDRGPLPEQVVDEPAASVDQVVVAAEDPDVRAVVWRLCRTQRCTHVDRALALTGDGFATRSVVRLREDSDPAIVPAGARTFLVSLDGPHPYLLDADGSRRPVSAPAPASPVRAGEVVTRWNGFGADDFVAVDPASGAAHRVAVPGRLVELQGDRSGRLQGLSDYGSDRAPVFFWSDDGGASWHDHRLTSTGRQLFRLVPTAADTMAVLVGGDGATLFPFGAVQRGTRDGATWEGFPQDSPPSAFVDGGAVLPDGRLLVRLEQAEEQFHAGTGSEPRTGLYVSDGADWGSFARLDPPDGAPGLSPEDVQWLRGADLALAGVSVVPGHATVYITENGGNRVFAVADGGRTWTEVRSR